MRDIVLSRLPIEAGFRPGLRGTRRISGWTFRLRSYCCVLVRGGTGGEPLARGKHNAGVRSTVRSITGLDPSPRSRLHKVSALRRRCGVAIADRLGGSDSRRERRFAGLAIDRGALAMLLECVNDQRARCRAYSLVPPGAHGPALVLVEEHDRWRIALMSLHCNSQRVLKNLRGLL